MATTRVNSEHDIQSPFRRSTSTSEFKHRRLPLIRQIQWSAVSILEPVPERDRSTEGEMASDSAVDGEGVCKKYASRPPCEL